MIKEKRSASFLTIYFTWGSLEPVKKFLCIVRRISLAVGGQAKDCQTGSFEILFKFCNFGQIFHIAFFRIRYDAFESVLCSFFRKARGELLSGAKEYFY
jgi:hypothetical protein